MVVVEGDGHGRVDVGVLRNLVYFSFFSHSC